MNLFSKFKYSTIFPKLRGNWQTTQLHWKTWLHILLIQYIHFSYSTSYQDGIKFFFKKGFLLLMKRSLVSIGVEDRKQITSLFLFILLLCFQCRMLIHSGTVDRKGQGSSSCEKQVIWAFLGLESDEWININVSEYLWNYIF